jgi:hypothetical protein
MLSSLDPIILFFGLGLLAAWWGSDLVIPDSISKFISIYLLLSLGLKGGYEVASAESLTGFVPVLSLGLLSCILISITLFLATKNLLRTQNAAALAACYGSVSAVTFVAAQTMLDGRGIDYSGYMVAIMALMEVPAILLALYMANCRKTEKLNSTTLPEIFKLLTCKSVILLIGGFCIGLALDEKSWSSIAPVTSGAFKGVLAFFLIDLGLQAQRQLREVWQKIWVALTVATAFPLLCGSLVLLVASWLPITVGDQILIAVLAGSASYIAAPAAIRSSLPGAQPSLYATLPLAVTFPFNIVLGIPIYIELSNLLAG